MPRVLILPSTTLLLCCLFAPFQPSVAADGSKQNAGNDLLAERDGVFVSESELMSRINALPLDARPPILGDPAQVAKMLDGLLLMKQLSKEAEQTILKDNVALQADLDLARYQVLSKAYIDAALARETPDFEALAKEKYLAEPQRFMNPARVDVRHISIYSQSRSDAEALELAKAVRARVDAGEDFQTLLEKYSDDPKKSESAGLIENIGEDALGDEAFVAALSQFRETGDVSGPHKTKLGYRIVRLERLDEPTKQPFDAIKKAFIDELSARWIEDRRTQLLRGFSAKDTVVDYAKLNQLMEAAIVDAGRAVTKAKE